MCVRACARAPMYVPACMCALGGRECVLPPSCAGPAVPSYALNQSWEPHEPAMLSSSPAPAAQAPRRVAPTPRRSFVEHGVPKPCHLLFQTLYQEALLTSGKLR